MRFFDKIQSNLPAGPTNLIYINHDQLNLGKWKSLTEDDDWLVFVESGHKMSAKPYHKKKIVFEWSSQRHFALECKEAGLNVLYIKTDVSIADALQIGPRGTTGGGPIFVLPNQPHH